MRLDALIGLAFATTTPHGLTSPHTTNSQAHFSIGTPSPHRAPTACRQPVSGTISLPSRGTFHHSLTVLSAIGHQEVFRLSGWARQIHTRFQESRTTWESVHGVRNLRLQGYYLLCRTFPESFDFITHFLLHDRSTARSKQTPQPCVRNACQLSHTRSLASSAFARHYSRNHYCFLFLWVLRCFTSPRSLPLPYTFRQGSLHMTGDIRGFPIRRPPDHRSFTNSPGLIAGYNVLHRLLVPRHPPIALSSFPQQSQEKIYKDARVHYEDLKTPTTTTTGTNAPTAVLSRNTAHTRWPRSQDPTMCSIHPPQQEAPTIPKNHGQSMFHPQKPSPARRPHPWPIPRHHTTTPERTPAVLDGLFGLLRKEVIQPHLPVRLPCYDLVLITSPTFDSSLPEGLGRRLRVLPTFMT